MVGDTKRILKNCGDEPPTNSYIASSCFHAVEQVTVTADAGPVSVTQRIVVRAKVAEIAEQRNDGNTGYRHQYEHHVALWKQNHQGSLLSSTIPQNFKTSIKTSVTGSDALPHDGQYIWST